MQKCLRHRGQHRAAKLLSFARSAPAAGEHLDEGGLDIIGGMEVEGEHLDEQLTARNSAAVVPCCSQRDITMVPSARM